MFVDKRILNEEADEEKVIVTKKKHPLIADSDTEDSRTIKKLRKKTSEQRHWHKQLQLRAKKTVYSKLSKASTPLISRNILMKVGAEQGQKGKSS